MFHGKDLKDINEELQRLQQENKALALRAQSVQVLGKVLQESQDENAQLRQDISDLKRELSESGVDVSQISLRTTPSLQNTRCFLSQQKDNSFPLAGVSFEEFEMVQRMPSGMSNHGSIPEESTKNCETPGFEFHIEDLSNGVKMIKDQTEQLLQLAQQMHSVVPTIKNPRERQNIVQKITSYCKKLEKRVQDVNTREKLLQGLFNQQEQLKEKVQEMENEQVSQEKVMNNLKLELNAFTEELQGIQDEIKVFGDAEVVNKEDLSLESMSSQTTSGSTASTSSHESSQQQKMDQGKLESEVSLTRPSCERCFELIKQLNQTIKQKKEAERQKEEILDVNHAWDAQYKKLKAETTKETKELKEQVEFYRTADNQRKYEAVRNSYKKVIDDERKMKEEAMEDKRRNDEKVKELEEEIKKMSLQIREQQMQPRLPNALYGANSTPLSSLAVQAGEFSPLVKEVEVLKQQLRIYADDFKCEREDRERIQGEKDTLETELKESKERIIALEEQVRVFQEDFKKETQEKDRLRRQLLTNRELSEPENRFSEMTRQVQAVAERQAKLRALRDEYEREERLLLHEQQGLQQQSRIMAIHPESQRYHSSQRYPDRYQGRRYEPLRPRGARPSDEMFYGGDVQADTRGIGREVPDSTNRAEDFRCPRCYRSFPPHDVDLFTSHVDRCVE